MVDSKVEMNSDVDNFNSLTNDPKNVQELTQYVRNTNLYKAIENYWLFYILGSESSTNNSG